MSGRLIEHGLTQRWSARRIAAALRDSETAGVVSLRGSRVTGFALMVHDFRHSQAHLLLLAVEIDVRRSGLGRALVGWLEKTARMGGIRRFRLEVRADAPGAQAFYECLGYREVGRLPGYYHDKLDAVQMVKSTEP